MTNLDGLLREKSPDPAGKKINIGRVIVQTGDVFKGFAAGLEEGLATRHPDLLQCLEAVGCEGGGQHKQAFAPRGGEPPEFAIGIRLKPGFACEP